MQNPGQLTRVADAAAWQICRFAHLHSLISDILALGKSARLGERNSTLISLTAVGRTLLKSTQLNRAPAPGAGFKFPRAKGKPRTKQLTLKSPRNDH